MKVVVDEVTDGIALDLKISILEDIRVRTLAPNLYFNNTATTVLVLRIHPGHDNSSFKGAADEGTHQNDEIKRSTAVIDQSDYYHGYINFDMGDLFIAKGDYTVFVFTLNIDATRTSIGWVHGYLNPQPAIQRIDEYAYNMPKDLRILGYIRERV